MSKTSELRHINLSFLASTTYKSSLSPFVKLVLPHMCF